MLKSPFSGGFGRCSSAPNVMGMGFGESSAQPDASNAFVGYHGGMPDIQYGKGASNQLRLFFVLTIQIEHDSRFSIIS